MDIISNSSGDLYKVLTRESPEFSSFGELYVSTVKPFAVKAWRMHKRLHCRIVVASGTVETVIYQPAENKFSDGELTELCLSSSKPCLLSIPPGFWYGFKGGSEGGTIINLLDELYDDRDVYRQEHSWSHIGYDWANMTRANKNQ